MLVTLPIPTGNVTMAMASISSGAVAAATAGRHDHGAVADALAGARVEQTHPVVRRRVGRAADQLLVSELVEGSANSLTKQGYGYTASGSDAAGNPLWRPRFTRSASR